MLLRKPPLRALRPFGKLDLPTRFSWVVRPRVGSAASTIQVIAIAKGMVMVMIMVMVMELRRLHGQVRPQHLIPVPASVAVLMLCVFLDLVFFVAAARALH